MKIALILSFCSLLKRSAATDAVTLGILVAAVTPPGSLIDGYVYDSEESSEEIFVKTTMKTTTMSIWQEIERLRKYYLECVEETHVKPELVKSLRSGSWENDHPALKRWVLCVLQKLDLMSLQGVLKHDTAMSKIRKEDEDVVYDLLEKCLMTKSKSGEDIAWDYVKCLSEKDKKKKFTSLGVFYKVPED